jgi:hypothetical protein
MPLGSIRHTVTCCSSYHSEKHKKWFEKNKLYLKHGIFEANKGNRPKHQGIPIFQIEAPKSSAVTLSNFLPRSSVMYLQAANVGTFLWPCGLTLEEDQDIMGLKLVKSHGMTQSYSRK